MSRTIKVPNVEPSAIINLEVSGAFLRQLQMTLLALGEQRSPEDFTKVLEKLKKNEAAEDLYEVQVHLFTALVASIEKAAMAQNKITYKELTIEDDKF